MRGLERGEGVSLGFMEAAVAAPHLQRVAVDIIHDLVAKAEEQQIRRRARGLGRLLLVPTQLFNKAQKWQC